MSDTQPNELDSTLTSIIQKLIDGGVKDDVWLSAIEQELTTQFLAAYADGADEDDPEDLSTEQEDIVEEFTKKQLEFLKGFKEDWFNGRYEDNPEAALSRIKMYARAANAVWWMGKTTGWVLPAYPCDGTTQCKTNCKCGWKLDILPGNGNCNAYWELGATKNCQTCDVRHEQWYPLKIRNGDLSTETSDA